MSWMLVRVAPGTIILLALLRNLACPQFSTRIIHVASVLPILPTVFSFLWEQPAASCSSPSSSASPLAGDLPSPGSSFPLSDPCRCTAVESLAYSSELNQIVCILPERGTHNARFRIRLGWEELLPAGHKGLDLALQVGRRESHWRLSSSGLAIMAIATVYASILKMNRREQDQGIFDNHTKLLTVHYSDLPSLVSITPHTRTHTQSPYSHTLPCQSQNVAPTYFEREVPA